jgi:hypothetical protein
MPFKDNSISRKYKHSWYVTNKERILKLRKEYYEMNIEKIRAYKKEHRKHNKHRWLGWVTNRCKVCGKFSHKYHTDFCSKECYKKYYKGYMKDYLKKYYLEHKKIKRDSL